MTGFFSNFGYDNTFDQKCEIKPGYKSDHSFIALEIIQNKFKGDLEIQ